MPLSAIPPERTLIIWHPANTLPDGYIKANGAAISRTVYAWLFSKIGTSFGTGNGSTTFNVPDLRGEFLRGLDDGRGIDAGRVLGSAQDATGIRNKIFNDAIVGANNVDEAVTSSDVDSFPTATVQTRVSQYLRVRPRNVAGLYCIAYMP